MILEQDGAGISQVVNTEPGIVTAWITISDADETNDTLTTNANTSAGSILIKHTNGTGSLLTIFTAGSAGGFYCISISWCTTPLN